MHQVSCTHLLHSSRQSSFAKLLSASLHCRQLSYSPLSGNLFASSLPGRGEEEELQSKDAAVPPQMCPLHFTLVCPIHCHFLDRMQSYQNHCLREYIPRHLDLPCMGQAVQMSSVHSDIYAWLLLIFCLQVACWSLGYLRK